jgi:hypothetical protein
MARAIKLWHAATATKSVGSGVFRVVAHEMDERVAVFHKRRAEIDLEVLEHKAELNDRLVAAADLIDGRMVRR